MPNVLLAVFSLSLAILHFLVHCIFFTFLFLLYPTHSGCLPTKPFLIFTFCPTKEKSYTPVIGAPPRSRSIPDPFASWNWWNYMEHMLPTHRVFLSNLTAERDGTLHCRQEHCLERRSGGNLKIVSMSLSFSWTPSGLFYLLWAWLYFLLYFLFSPYFSFSACAHSQHWVACLTSFITITQTRIRLLDEFPPNRLAWLRLVTNYVVNYSGIW